MELNDHQPPKLAKRLFKWYCRSDRYEELSGDLDELYRLRSEKRGKRSAFLFYWWNVIRCCRSYSWKTTLYSETSGALIFSFWKLGVRNMWKNKWTLLINVLGLGFALSLSVITYMLTGYNREFDRKFSEREDLYRLHSIRVDDDYVQRYEYTPYEISQQLQEDLSFIANSISIYPQDLFVSHGDGFIENESAFVSQNFLTVFDVNFIYGNAEFFPQHGIILTKSLATKLFPDENPLGQIMEVHQYHDRMGEVVVCGVIDDPPVNSSYIYESLLHLDLFKSFIEERDKDSEFFTGFGVVQFVQFESGVEIQETEKYLQKFVEEFNKKNPERKLSFFDVLPYYKPEINEWFLRSANMPHALDEILLFGLIAALILIITCVNISITHSTLITSRLKEIGVRKVIGSSNPQIIIQFMFEMLIIVALSAVVALPMVNIFGKEVWDLFDQSNLTIDDLRLDHFTFFLLLFVFLISIVTGILPALNAKKFEPVTILNHTLKSKGSRHIHYILLTLQFSFSITLIICAFSFINNVNFQKNRSFGYDSRNLLMVKVTDSTEYTKLKNEVSKLSYVNNTFGTFHNLSGFHGRKTVIVNQDTIETDAFEVGESYLSSMELSFVEGKDFYLSPGPENPIVINSNFASEYFKDDSSIMKQVIVNGKKHIITGVVNEHHHWSLYSGGSHAPLIYTVRSDSQLGHLCIRYGDMTKRDLLNSIKLTYEELFDKPMNYIWQDDYTFMGEYEMAQGVKDLFMTLAIISILICIIGMMGIVNLRLNHLSKTISIRKVLGGKANQIFLAVNLPFIISLILSLLFGTLLGHFFSMVLLEAMHFDFQLLPVESELMISSTVFVGILSVIYFLSLHRINQSPVKGLRDE